MAAQRCRHLLPGAVRAAIQPRESRCDHPCWVSMANRRKLLLTWLSYNPHAMIAIGDHIYWDLRSPAGSVMLGMKKTGGEDGAESHANGIAVDSEGRIDVGTQPGVRPELRTIWG